MCYGEDEDAPNGQSSIVYKLLAHFLSTFLNRRKCTLYMNTIAEDLDSNGNVRQHDVTFM